MLYFSKVDKKIRLVGKPGRRNVIAPAQPHKFLKQCPKTKNAGQYFTYFEIVQITPLGQAKDKKKH